MVSFQVLSSVLWSRFFGNDVILFGWLFQWRVSLNLSTSWYTLLLLMAFSQWTIPLFTSYGWWELKLIYCPVNVGFQFMDVLIPWSVKVINTSRKDNLLLCSFSIENCIDEWIEFTCSISAWASSWWGQRRNMLSTYLTTFRLIINSSNSNNSVKHKCAVSSI